VDKILGVTTFFSGGPVAAVTGTASGDVARSTQDVDVLEADGQPVRGDFCGQQVGTG
jgi:hypothetical protein